MARTEVKVEPRSVQRATKTPAQRAPRQWPAPVERVLTYLREVSAEMKRVDWPTRREATSATIVVVIVLTLMACYLFAFDSLYTAMFKKWLLRTPG
jgi:preprotein translocase subunit SecE